MQAMDDRGMNLPDLRQRPKITVLVHPAYRLFEQLAIALNVFRGVVRGQSEVERFAAVAGRNPSLPGAETMHQPRNVSKDICPQDFNLSGG
jgi:hypothetical protein